MTTQVFPMIPPAARTFWSLGTILLVPVLVSLLVFYLAYSAKNVRFEVSDQGLRIEGDRFYGRQIPAASLVANEAKLLDLQTSEYRPRRKTNGVGLPGYKAGWYRLRNGRKALVFLTVQERAVYIPTRDGYSVLLSPAQPDQFLNALQRSGAAK